MSGKLRGVVVIPDPKERERKEKARQYLDQLQQITNKVLQERDILLLETTCPTCGGKRYVSLKKDEESNGKEDE